MEIGLHMKDNTGANLSNTYLTGLTCTSLMPLHLLICIKLNVLVFHVGRLSEKKKTIFMTGS